MVRYFDDDEGEEEVLTPSRTEGVAIPIWSGRVKLPGQHQLLGWHLDRKTMEFLVEVGAEVDADEYG